MNRIPKPLLQGLSVAAFFGTISCATAQQAPPTQAPTATAAAAAEAITTQSLQITESLITKTNAFGQRKNPDVHIDTVVIHFASAIYWFDPSFQKIVGQEGKDYAASINLTPENLAEHKYDWQLVKAIFEAYGVSSHYAIGRDGEIVRFVHDADRAYHAGPSKMPMDETRTGANEFSIGIELMASHPADDATVVTPEDAYTPEQYASLQALMAQLCADHGIRYVVGHDEIAPGRKTDPGPLFQWDKIRNADYSPTACE